MKVSLKTVRSLRAQRKWSVWTILTSYWMEDAVETEREKC